MSKVEDIKLKILCNKKKLNEKQQEYVSKRILKQQEGIKILSSLNPRAITSTMCELAYLTQMNDEGREKVCDLTPLRCIKNITNGEYLIELIKQDYTKYDFINFDKLRESDNVETLLKITATYGDKVTESINNFHKNMTPTDDEILKNKLDMGRLMLVEEDYKYAKQELSKIEQEKQLAKEEKERELNKYLDEQVDFITSVAEECRSEDDTMCDD